MISWLSSLYYIYSFAKQNIDSLKVLHEDCVKFRFDVIALSEVWRVLEKSTLEMEGYLLEVKCRDGKERGGGVGAYIRSNLKYVVKDYTVKHTESIWFEINNGEFQKVMVGVLYRKPNTDVKEFQESLLTVLKDIKVDRRSSIII